MLSKAAAQLVEEVVEYFRKEDGEKVREDPEAYLVSMLTLIKKRLTVPSATLQQTIQLTAYEGYLKEAREKIKQAS